MHKLFAILFVLILASCQQTGSNFDSKNKTIMLKANGEIETAPDMASFNIYLNCIDKNIQTAKKCLVDQSNELNQKLLSFGIKQEDILTSSVNLSKNYKWENQSNIFDGYSSNLSIYVTVKDLNKLDEVYTDLLENNLLEINGLSYSHSRMDSLKNEAYVKALANAGDLADKLLKELPENKKEIINIGNVKITASNPSNFKSNERLEVASNYTGNAESTVAVSKGNITVDATLFVEYLIK